MISAREYSETVEAHAREALNLVALALGFEAQVERADYRTVVACVAPVLFMELELDWREEAVFLLVGRTEDGARPDGYYCDSVGRKVRWHLVEVCRGNGNPRREELIVDVLRAAEGSGPDAMLLQVDVLVALLHEVLEDLPTLVDDFAR